MSPDTGSLPALSPDRWWSDLRAATLALPRQLAAGARAKMATVTDRAPTRRQAPRHRDETRPRVSGLHRDPAGSAEPRQSRHAVARGGSEALVWTVTAVWWVGGVLGAAVVVGAVLVAVAIGPW